MKNISHTQITQNVQKHAYVNNLKCCLRLYVLIYGESIIHLVLKNYHIQSKYQTRHGRNFTMNLPYIK